MGAKNRKKEERRKEERRKRQDAPSDSDGRSLGWKILVFLSGLLFAVMHRNHVAAMFENDRHFSHLSDMEREMTFRTEMGLYYSYYKTVVNAPTVWEGIHEITHDNVSEYGHTINTLKRFNLYPELTLAMMYRAYMAAAEKVKWKTHECWQTNRGEGLDPIISCEGMGNQFYFYINFVFLIAGTLAATLFFYGVLISDSIFGGFLTVAAFFFNHGEATRVQWTPPLRESFGYPVWAIQMLIVSYVIKYRKSGFKWTFLILLFTLNFMLPWQFASFAISTQMGSLFVAYILDYIPASTLRTITFGHLGAFVLGFVMLFGNEMLLTSLFFSSLLTIQDLKEEGVFCQVILLLEGAVGQRFRTFSFRPLFLILLMGIFAVGTLGIKFGIGNALDIKDDAHVFDILNSKFSNFSNFHTRLYTCAVEFDFLEISTYWKLTKSLLLPASLLGAALFLLQLLRIEIPHLIWRDVSLKEKQYGELVYNLVQLLAYTLMAVIIMRLKLFWTPHLCIFAALLASPSLIRDLFGDILPRGVREATCVALIGCMAVEGVGNIRHQWNIMGEYSNIPQEELFNWITKDTPKDAVFCGAMPTMANVKLSTGRPIINHPHYEDAGLRERTMKVYSIFSKKPIGEVHAILKNMGVNYVVFEAGWCSRGPKAGCSMPEIWDQVDPSNKNGATLCEVLKTGKIAPFQVAFQNQQYRIFKVQ